jgi:lysophospholipase L1-like esterase
MGDVPAWFRMLDTDGDGRVTLQAWQAGGRPVREFQAMDRKGDGVVTAEEARAAARTVGPASRAGPGAGVSGRMMRSAPEGDTSSKAPLGSRGLRSRQGQRDVQGRADVMEEDLLPPAGAAPGRRRSSPASSHPEAVPTPKKPAATPPAAPQSSSPAVSYWDIRQVEIQSEAAHGHTNVLFLGDSITDLLQNGSGSLVWDFFFAPLGAEDFAVSGYTTAQILDQVQAGDIGAVSPNVVILLIGTNDLALGSSPDQVAAAIGQIVHGIAKQSPQTRILLLGILPRGAMPFDPLRGLIAQTNARLARLADGLRVRYLDIGSNFLLPDGTLSSLVMGDYLHPTLLGYDIYTLSVWQPLNELLSAGPLRTATKPGPSRRP